ncbi:hypothetical protein [Pedobacter faecalis]|uniref:hypothetical protein n=1 Tax=Pedobacter faecalis TaxID=3041495 RepID=UPI00254A582E|nr:hypothetical protein [Pedobacter sp. ELA7]
MTKRGFLVLILLLAITAHYKVMAQRKNSCDVSAYDRCKWGFSKFKGGFESSFHITPSRFNKGRRIIVYNKSLAELYAIALGAGNQFSCEQIIVDVRKPQMLQAKYCYELNTPPDLTDVMFVIMQQHLERQYPEYTAALEERTIGGVKMSCVVLRDKES